ncbi:MAG TPA: hypothetical protein VJ970_05605 [Flavobacteriaceae bacterium]|nr:hypothetical protein [Flavobacteriaceae bacterium]
MKTYISICLVAVLAISNGFAQSFQPYIKVTESSETITNVAKKVKEALQTNSFEIIGEYTPANNTNLKVIVFTNNNIKNTVIKVKDRGALAAAFKVALVKNNGKVTVSYTNPDYIFRAYLQNDYNKHKTTLNQFGKDVKNALSAIGNEFKSFGGAIKGEKLKNYHYKIMMPYFTDPITLNEFNSFEEGLKIIQQNLNAKKGNTTKVYELIYKNEKVAVFGVGLNSPSDGESHFLPKIGEAHAAALPYEIILQGNKATMLHGKYRIALHWPELTMGTFMKIMSTPGDIEDTLESICE